MISPIAFGAIVFLTSLVAGTVGSLVGLGGGFIVVPVLTLFLHVPLKYAIGAGLVSVICSSSNASAPLLRNSLPNLRVASFLEIATTAGALTGVLLSGIASTHLLSVLFGLVLFYSAYSMHLLRKPRSNDDSESVEGGPTVLSDRLQLHGSYWDAPTMERRSYRVVRPLLGLIFMYGAGILSALLGIGSGALKVPALDRAMRLPIKVSTSTSNLMVGVTSTGSALVYLQMGNIQPFLVTPVALGVLAGSSIGARLLIRLHGDRIRHVFITILLLLGVQMLWKGIQ